MHSFLRMLLPALLLGSLACAYRVGHLYTVGEGETLTHLAHTQGISVERLLAANPRLKENDLKPGQRLLIPVDVLKPDPLKEVAEATEASQGEAGLQKEVTTPPDTAAASPAPTDVSSNSALEAPVELPPSPSSMPVTAQPSPQSTAPLYKLPEKPVLDWPLDGKILASFGKRREKMHNGLDIQGRPGEEIRASETGLAVYEGNTVEGYGNMVILKHGGGIYTVYAYLGEVLVKPKTYIKKGEALARLSQQAKQAFFHFEVRSGKTAIDPLKLLPKR